MINMKQYLLTIGITLSIFFISSCFSYISEDMLQNDSGTSKNILLNSAPTDSEIDQLEQFEIESPTSQLEFKAQQRFFDLREKYPKMDALELGRILESEGFKDEDNNPFSNYTLLWWYDTYQPDSPILVK